MHPRRLLLLLCLVLATSLQGQDTMLLKQLGVNVCRKNQRASIDLSGQTAFAFAPDGKYWVVSNYGLAYFSNDFESEWHSATQVCQLRERVVRQCKFPDAVSTLPVDGKLEEEVTS